MFQYEFLELMLPTVELLLRDTDRFKQRAGTEMLIGLLRGVWQSLFWRIVLKRHAGSKHWSKQWRDQLWGWFMSNVQSIHNSIRPDTLSFWDAAFNVSRR